MALNQNGVISKLESPKVRSLALYFFLIYINDLENGIQSEIKFFADDTSLFSIVHDVNISADDLNHDLSLISQWAFQSKMSFNPDPNKQAVQLIFYHKVSRPNHPKIYFNNIEVVQVSEHKHLKRILDWKLSFSSHINEKNQIARKRRCILDHTWTSVTLYFTPPLF